MRNPETRSLKRCVYTPVVNNAEVGDDRPGFVPAQPHLKLNILREVFTDPQLRAFLAPHLKEGYDVVLPALVAAEEGDITRASRLLADVDMSRVVSVAEQSMSLQKRLADQIAGALESLVDVDAAPAGAGAEGHALHGDTASAEATVLLAAKHVPAGGDDVATEFYLAEEPAEQPVTTIPVSSADLVARLAKQVPGSPLLLRSLDVIPTTHRPMTMDLHYTVDALKASRGAVEQRQARVRTLIDAAQLEPIGYLHLERLNFTPVGYDQGELVYSLPMLPGEIVRLSHREWSRTETEYTELVATSLETASQELLSEKSELAESSSTQEQRTSALSATFTASGGFGPVQISSSVGYNVQNSRTSTRQSSAKQAQEITKSASSRSKKEHKVTFRVSTQYEVEEQSFRELKNESADAVRWDFHRMLKKWRIDLYRYDVRLTYDLVVPEPGSFLLRHYAERRELEKAMREPFMVPAKFVGTQNDRSLRPGDIVQRNYRDLMRYFGANLQQPPEPLAKQFPGEQTFTEQQNIGFGVVDVSFPEGYRIYAIGGAGSSIGGPGGPGERYGHLDPLLSSNKRSLGSIKEGTNSFLWRYTYDWNEPGGTPTTGDTLHIMLYAKAKPTTTAIEAWQNECYQRILEAAKASYEIRQAAMKAKHAELVAIIGRDEDALTLRRIEREEIVKAVVRWLRPPNVSFYPGGRELDLDVEQTSSAGDLDLYSKLTGRVTLSKELRAEMLEHGRIVKFLHHAIEWENVNYVLYPYLWTDPDRWDFKQSITHQNYEHRCFLRAGAARVVLTIRPDFEKAFLAFMQTGDVDAVLEKDSVYLTVAEELRAFAHTQYPYTPGANDEREENRVDTWYEYTPTGAMDVTRGLALANSRPAPAENE